MLNYVKDRIPLQSLRGSCSYYYSELCCRMASRVLCATLAIPIPASRSAIDTLLEMGEGTLDKQRKLASLLMLQNPPKRQGLVTDLVSLISLQSDIDVIQSHR